MTSSVTPGGEPTPPGVPPPPDPAAPAGAPAAPAAGSAWLTPTLVYVFGLGAWGVTSKLALEHLSWEGLLFWSGAGYLLIVSYMLGRGIVRLRLDLAAVWAILAAFTAITALVAFYIALEHGPANQIVPISAAYPAVTVILGAIFLRERLSVGRVAGLLLVIGGVVMITAN